MPTETAVIVAIIVLTFAAFALAMAWAAYHSRNVRAPGATYFDAMDSWK